MTSFTMQYTGAYTSTNSLTAMDEFLEAVEADPSWKAVDKCQSDIKFPWQLSTPTAQVNIVSPSKSSRIFSDSGNYAPTELCKTTRFATKNRQSGNYPLVESLLQRLKSRSDLCENFLATALSFRTGTPYFGSSQAMVLTETFFDFSFDTAMKVSLGILNKILENALIDPSSTQISLHSLSLLATIQEVKKELDCIRDFDDFHCFLEHCIAVGLERLTQSSKQSFTGYDEVDISLYTGRADDVVILFAPLEPQAKCAKHSLIPLADFSSLDCDADAACASMCPTTGFLHSSLL